MSIWMQILRLSLFKSKLVIEIFKYYTGVNLNNCHVIDLPQCIRTWYMISSAICNSKAP